MIEDIAGMCGTRLGPGTLYGAIARLKVNLYYQSASGIQSYTLPSAVSVASGAEATIA